MKSLLSARGARRLSLHLAACGAALLAAAMPAQGQVNRIKGNANALILDGVRVSDDMEIFYLSGQLPSPIDAGTSMADVKSIEEMGDSKTQTISTLNKIKALLEAQGYSMSDLVKLSLFVAADPRTGKMDFAGVNEGFRQFFGTQDNPQTVARSTFQVAGLVGPHYLIEIEAIAARRKSDLGAAFKLPALPDMSGLPDAREAAPEKALSSARPRPQGLPQPRRKRPIPA